MIDELSGLSTPLTILAVIGASIFGIYLVAHVVGFVFGAVAGVLGLVGALVGRLGLFVGRQVQDALHFVGGILTGVVIAPLAAANLAVGRFGSAGHYARAFRDELLGSGGSLYRVALGNPIWLLGLSPLTDGLERRLPDLVSRAPRRPARRPRKGKRGATPAFEGYTVTGELEAGGSGARLFLAQPHEGTVARYRKGGHPDPGQVVIKSFALTQGSTVPQIVRESRSLEAARQLGLVLDHELDDESFWYAMPYVPGEDLDVVTRRLHARAGGGGLDDRGLLRVMGYTSDLLATLDRFHRAGLWHKDIKPSNLIVTDERAHLVDLGLVTPLASAMTLTTHGTEFFRDPELVRMAMKGVKVQEIDGVKFDLYSVGALLYSMLENSFPAHGNLSRLEKRCPDALSFVVRRAMADLSQRYTSAEEMSHDLDVLLAARDPWRVRPADLPSMTGASGAPRARRAAFAQGSDAPPVRPLPPGHEEPARGRGPRRSRGVLGGLTRVAMFMMMFGGLTVLARTARTRVRERASDPRHVSLSTIQLEQRRADRPSRGALGELERLERGGRILLLPSAGLDSSDGDLANLRQALTERGHTLVGEGSDPESIELVARARSAAGLSDLSDDVAADGLQALLDEREDVDALIWLEPSRGDGLGFRILVRGERR